MDPEPTDPNLLLLSVNLSDSEPDEAAAPTATTTSTSTCLATEHQPTRAERTALSEEAFQELKRTYRPKVENGDLYKTISIPSPSQASSPPQNLTKPEAQALLHAAEELYFFKRYDTAVEFLRSVLGAEADVDADGDGSGAGAKEGDAAKNSEGKQSQDEAERNDKEAVTGKGDNTSNIDVETRKLLRYYLQRCLARARETSQTEPGTAREVSCH